MATSRARAFWVARERLQQSQDQHTTVTNGTVSEHANGTFYAKLGKVNGYDKSPAAEADVWAGLYCTLRDKRRGRSRTPGGVSTSAPPPPRSLTPRSLTPSSLSSGRTTPTLSPSPGYHTSCAMEPRLVPTHYSSSVVLHVGSTKKRYVEEVTFQTRLVPKRFSEGITKETTIPHRHFTSILEIQCLPPAITIINLNQNTSQLNEFDDEYDA